MMSRKIEEKKLDYIQCIAPEIENVNINSEKSTITQILLNLIKNALLNIERGELKVE
jgi:signal transduction histidine kinase